MLHSLEFNIFVFLNKRSALSCLIGVTDSLLSALDIWLHMDKPINNDSDIKQEHNSSEKQESSLAERKMPNERNLSSHKASAGNNQNLL